MKQAEEGGGSGEKGVRRQVTNCVFWLSCSVVEKEERKENEKQEESEGKEESRRKCPSVFCSAFHLIIPV